MSRPQMYEAMTRILNAERSQVQILFGQAPGLIAVLSGKDHTFDTVNEAFYRLALHLPPETTMVMGDKKRLVQVFANILANAAKYTNAGGHIVLTTDVREASMLVDVTDDGIGMAPDLAVHAFELFSQAQRSSDRSAGGLGLGLALVKSLIELHQGTVACHSEGPGLGSTFSVCLPRLAVAERQDQAPFEERALPPATRALRILVVDDNVDAATMLGTPMLSRAAAAPAPRTNRSDSMDHPYHRRR